MARKNIILFVAGACMHFGHWDADDFVCRRQYFQFTVRNSCLLDASDEKKYAHFSSYTQHTKLPQPPPQSQTSDIEQNNRVWELRLTSNQTTEKKNLKWRFMHAENVRTFDAEYKIGRKVA